MSNVFLSLEDFFYWFRRGKQSCFAFEKKASDEEYLSGNHYSFLLGENICWWHILNQPQQINASAFVVLPTKQKRVTILGRRQVVKVACWNEAEKNPPRDKSTQALSSFLSFYSFIKIHQNRAHYIFILYRSLQAVKSFLFPPFSSAWKGGFRLWKAYYATSKKTPIIISSEIFM